MPKVRMNYGGRIAPLPAALLLSLVASSGAEPRDLSPAERQAVEEVVVPAIKYPGEVEFTWPKYNGINHVYCGAVHAKDQAGDYDYYAEYHALVFSRDDGTPYAGHRQLYGAGRGEPT